MATSADEGSPPLLVQPHNMERIPSISLFYAILSTLWSILHRFIVPYSTVRDIMVAAK
jgi:hypothetical protein